MTIKFNLNSRLEVFSDDKIYKSIIQDEDSDYLYISIPVRDGEYLTPSAGEYLDAFYYDGVDVYRFETKVQGRKIEGLVRQIVLEYPKDIKKVQRRKFVRVDFMNPVKFNHFPNSIDYNKNLAILAKSPQYSGTIVDLSGGGFRLKTAQPLSLGEVIATDLNTENQIFKVSGEVVRVTREEDGSYTYGISFSEMDDRSTERIIEFVFSTMRKQMKKM